MKTKLIMDQVPEPEWTYNEILTWLFQIRDTWNIKGIAGYKPEDFRTTLKKKEVLEYIYDNFESQEKRESELYVTEKNWDCYDVEYCGKGNLIKLQTHGEFFHFVKGISLTFYDISDPILQLIFKEYKQDFIVAGRNLYSHESQIIDVSKKIKNRQISQSNQSFFQIW